MNFLRKLVLLVTSAVFIGVGLWATFSYSWQVEYFYYPSNKSLFNENGPTKGLCVHSKDYPKGDNPHYIPNLKPIIEKYLSLWIDLEDGKFHFTNLSISKAKNSLFKETVIPYLDENFTSKLLHLFLLNASFLL